MNPFCKVYEFFSQTIMDFVESARFLLSYNRIEIPPELAELLERLMYFPGMTQSWVTGIKALANKEHEKFCIDLIKNSSGEPPEKSASNLINYFVDYYQTLVACREWVINYEILLSQLVPNDIDNPSEASKK